MNIRRVTRSFLAAILLTGTVLTPPAEAQDNASGGLLWGAGSGALLGQAIGRDTQATLLGTAIGGVLGYIVGNEMDKEAMPVAQRRTMYQETEWPSAHRRDQRHSERRATPRLECRETEILAYVDGRPETVLATACYDHGDWVLVRQEPVEVTRTIIIDRHNEGRYSRTSFRDRPVGRNHWRRW